MKERAQNLYSQARAGTARAVWRYIEVVAQSVAFSLQFHWARAFDLRKGIVMTDSDPQVPDGEKAWGDLKDRFRTDPGEDLDGAGTGAPVSPKNKKSDRSTLMIGGAILGLIVIVLLVMNRPKSKPDFDDLGAGVSNATGLKGHLITRWQGKAQYQLEFGPIDPRGSAEFALVAGNPPQPLSVNIRILDPSGFALCGKEILLPYYPGGPQASKPQALSGETTSHNSQRESEERQANLELMQVQEQDRERGKDVFQSKLGSDGEVASITAQGVLPCSADQYQHFDYWDFSTNFPTIEEQEKLLKHATAVKAAEERRAGEHNALRKPQSAFYVDGDDSVSGYDASTQTLESSENRTFYIGKKSDQAAAAAWAGSFAHFHYKCDQHATCSLQRAGTSVVITGRMNE